MTGTKRFPLLEQHEELCFFMPGTPQLTIRPARDGEEPHIEVQGPAAKLDQLQPEQTAAKWAVFLCFANFGNGAGELAWGTQLKRRMRDGNANVRGVVTASGPDSIAIGACGSISIQQDHSGDSRIRVAGYDINTLADEPVVLNAAAMDSPFAITVVIAPGQFGFKRK